MTRQNNSDIQANNAEMQKVYTEAEMNTYCSVSFNLSETRLNLC